MFIIAIIYLTNTGVIPILVNTFPSLSGDLSWYRRLFTVWW